LGISKWNPPCGAWFFFCGKGWDKHFSLQLCNQCMRKIGWLVDGIGNPAEDERATGSEVLVWPLECIEKISRESEIFAETQQLSTWLACKNEHMAFGKLQFSNVSTVLVAVVHACVPRAMASVRGAL
jgi:hypothetical protein